MTMGTSPCCPKDSSLNRGAWTAKEDMVLREYITIHGEGGWRALPKKAGLKRCGKSCRLRWLNYLRPDIKRGDISPDEEDLIIRLHGLLGNRWSLIAGRLPSRTDNEIKNYWNTHLGKKSIQEKETLPKVPHTKSKASPTVGHRVLKSTPVKATAVRIATKIRNKYMDGGNSDHHQDFKSTEGAAKTVKASESWGESFIAEFIKEGDSESVDIALTTSIVHSGSSSMEISEKYSPPCIPNFVHRKIQHFQPCTAENEVSPSGSLLYLNDLSSPEFDLLPPPGDFGIQELEASPSSEMEQVVENSVQNVKSITASHEQEMEEELYATTVQHQGDWVDELHCLQKSSPQWLSLLLSESEEDWEERSSKLILEDSELFP